MHKLIKEKGKVDDEVVKKSQELDKVLNEYHQLLSEDEE